MVAQCPFRVTGAPSRILGDVVRSPGTPIMPRPRTRSSLAGPLTALLALGGPWATAAAQIPWTPVASGFPVTAAEKNRFTAHTRYLGVGSPRAGATTEMRLGTYGTTLEGRELLTRSSVVRS